MTLVARLVFDKGEPVDVRLKPEQKEAFLEDIRKGNFFHDTEGHGVFYANLEYLRYFYIAMESVASSAGEVEGSKEKPSAEA